MQKIAFQGLKFSKFFRGRTPLGDCVPSAHSSPPKVGYCAQSHSFSKQKVRRSEVLVIAKVCFTVTPFHVKLAVVKDWQGVFDSCFVVNKTFGIARQLTIKVLTPSKMACNTIT